MDKEIQELLIYVEEECDALKKLPKQLTEKEATLLVERYGYEAVRRQLGKMNNWMGIKNNRSVYQTCEKWFEIDIRKGYIRPAEPKQALRGGNVLKENFLKKYPIGTIIESPSGKIYSVLNENFLEAENHSLLPLNQAIKIEFTKF